MRTKTLLLSAAALLVAGIVSSQAQPVYSQNVVGYANVVTPNGGTYLLSVPFAIGSSNGANEIWPAASGALPDFSTLQLWNVDHYDVYYNDNNGVYAPNTHWVDSSFSETPAPEVKVGDGFFITPTDNSTNVFAGTIAVNVGTSNVNVYANGGTYLVAPVVPYAGSVTNGNPVTGTGGPNLTAAAGLPDFSTFQFWNVDHYDVFYNDNSGVYAPNTHWVDSSFSETAPPNISVGQGFFITPTGDFPWTVGL